MIFHTFRRAGVAFALALVLLPPGVPAATHGRERTAPPRKSAPLSRRGRDTKVIDDGWTFLTDPADSGAARGWVKTPPADSEPIAVPSLWTTRAAPGYSGVAWYWRQLEPPGEWAGQTIRLRFEAVAEHADVWLNGQKLGAHAGGATPFEFDVTKAVKIGAKNLLAVRVEGASGGAGIWQGVMLMAHDEAYITDVFPYGGPVGNLAADIEIFNASDKSGAAELDARVLSSASPTGEIKKSGQILSLTPKRNVTSMLINVPKKRVMPWSPDSPTVYFLDLAFHQDKDVLDTTETTIGFRDLKWTGGAITINGAPVAPKAVAPELTRPVVIATEEDRDAARGMLKKLKNAGVNVVYLESPPPALLALADTEGLLVVEGARHALPDHEAETEVTELIRRDRSHASIVAWDLRGMGETVAGKARKLDSTRFVFVGVPTRTALYPPHAEDSQPIPLPRAWLPR